MSNKPVSGPIHAEAAPLASFEESRRLIAAAGRFMPGGVSSNFRIGMAPHPLVFERAEGACLFDVDGNRLIDYYLGMGPMILGHNPESVRKAAVEQLDHGILFGGQSRVEAEAAELFCAMVPCAEKLRFAGSGSEAAQAALRLARAATGRSTIVKFEGHYHGWFDNVLVSVAATPETAGDRARPNRLPGSAGQDATAWGNVEVLTWNDLALLEARLAQGDVAAVIMEPAMCNSGAIFPADGYLEGVRAACSRAGTVLIFDEVITGFRVGPGGAQQRLGVTPDLAIFAKAVANGFPVAAIAGKAELLDLFVAGGALHGGTYNSHPVSMAATLATLRALADGKVHETIERRGRRLMDGIAAALAGAGIPATVTGFPQIFHVAFGLTEPARDYRDLMRMDRARYVRFCGELLKRRVRVLERGAWFMSAAHDDAIVDETLEAVTQAAAAI
ncbi:aminotransferase class III-fold pyridoxal phosphate-dependent enzyme [Geminicoccaceae bacterium 1502E]|nr:aminotransferase class III-fold pyridoxal phosphate-dependent enzyme [Geminicoccaceae bacterium 1502E]